MARLLRGRGVPMEDIGAMLGHRQPHADTTEVFYADAAPDYLGRVVAGIESIMDEIRDPVPARGCSPGRRPLPPSRRLFGRPAQVVSPVQAADTKQ